MAWGATRLESESNGASNIERGHANESARERANMIMIMIIQRQ